MTESMWKSELGFADRMAVVERMATSIEAADPLCTRPEAMRMAQKDETDCFRDASSKNEYSLRVAAKLRELIAAAAAPTPEPNEDDEPQKFPTDESPHPIGAYRHAVPFASGLFSTIYKTTPHGATPGNKRSIIALKVTNTSSEKPPHDAKREASLLRAAGGNPRIVPLIEDFTLPPSTVVLALPFLPHTLAALLETGALEASEHRAAEITADLLSGIAHIHSLGIIHRDIKPSNILFSSTTSHAYIADFGIAWSGFDGSSEPAEEKITDVGTTCYRAPELLFGFRGYGTGVDMWALGCVVAECLDPNHNQLFDAGDLGSELRLIASIFQMLGTPTQETWPETKKFPDWGKIGFYEYPPKAWEEVLPGVAEEGRALVEALVKYESGERLQAEEALKHPFVASIPRTD